MFFNEECKVTYNVLAPSLQKLFKDGLNKHLANSNQNLNDEIERETKAIAKVKQDILDAIDKFKSDQFGCAGVRGRVLKYDIQSLYADDHFFNIDLSQGNNPEWLYKYNFVTGKCFDSTGQEIDIPWRSFLYDESMEKFWYYWYPGKFEEIKWRYVKKGNSGSTSPTNLLTSGFDTYDKHVRYYKIYDNGWCEQVGAYAHTKKDMSNQSEWISSGGDNYHTRYVTFKIPYKDTNYIFTCGGEINQPICTHAYLTWTKYPDKIYVGVCGGGTGNSVGHWYYSTYHAAGFVDLQALGFNV